MLQKSIYCATFFGMALGLAGVAQSWTLLGFTSNVQNNITSGPTAAIAQPPAYAYAQSSPAPSQLYAVMADPYVPAPASAPAAAPASAAAPAPPPDPSVPAPPPPPPVPISKAADQRPDFLFVLARLDYVAQATHTINPQNVNFAPGRPPGIARYVPRGEF